MMNDDDGFREAVPAPFFIHRSAFRVQRFTRSRIPRSLS
jgi:hypothetical protein